MELARGIFAERVHEIVDVVRETLGVRVVLIDRETSARYVALPDGQWAREYAREILPAARPGSQGLHLRVNRRWRMHVLKDGLLQADAETLSAWAVRKLGALLPDDMTDIFNPPAGTGGGTSGPAELGIPAWWVRKTRS